jgi:hypothetical protein
LLGINHSCTIFNCGHNHTTFVAGKQEGSAVFNSAQTNLVLKLCFFGRGPQAEHPSRKALLQQSANPAVSDRICLATAPTKVAGYAGRYT